MESLYRKYRPLTFESVVGQQHIVSTLEHAVTEGRLSHAYLFCGPRGTGKTTMARILAKALLCQKAEAARAEGASGCMPDGTCPECTQIAEGIHPDVYELDAASRTGVDNVREEIIGSVNFAPVRGAYKVYIIDEVHMLTVAAFNALLKTLEEPPAHVVFVMCTTDPQKIPETILSRCQRFDFHRIGNEDIEGRLAYICEQEGFAYDAEALEIVAKHARGGMRDALSTLEQLSVFGGGAVRADDARALLGEVASSVLAEFARALAARDVATLFSLVRAQVDEGNDLMELTRDLIAHLRDVYMVRVAGAAREVVDATPEELEALSAEAALFEGNDRVARMLTVLDDAALEMRNAADTRLVLEIALTRLARPASDLTLEALADRLDRIEAQLAAGVPSAPLDADAASSLMGRPAAAPAARQEAAPSAAPVSAPARAAAARPHAAAPWDAPASPAPQRKAPAPSAVPGPVRSAAAASAPAPVQDTAPSPVPSPAPASPERPVSPAPGRAPVSEAAAAPAPAPAVAHVQEPAPQEPACAPVPQKNEAAPSGAPAPAAAPVTDEGDLQRRWAEVVHRVTVAQPSRGALLQSSRARTDDGDTLTVAFPAGSGFAIKMLGRADSEAAIHPVVAEVFGTRKVHYVMGDAPARPAAPAPASPSQVSQAPRPQPDPAPSPAAPAPEAAAPASPAPAAPAPRPATAPAPESAPRSGETPAPAPVTAVKPAAPAPAQVSPGFVPFTSEASAPATPASPAASVPAAPAADQTSGPTVISEPSVEEDRRAWEDEVVPYDDAFIAGYEAEEDLPPFDMPVEPPAASAPAVAGGSDAPAVEGAATPAAPRPAASPAVAKSPSFDPAAVFNHDAPPAEVPETSEDAVKLLDSVFGSGVIVHKE
ncbi:DNA polymerase III subunit gamma/tau [Collinsella intestinalis]|uniref:DNA polymerase III subunit gamma/tau n=1 Tax=Collinsella intestinalis TaxID=147207 RepID=UPI0025A44311|nr:DNA polymerase III subunit gamma/tau [Collinsella intestinalis]MDM8163302.1 DNA polymerase III subunit gamma/tau [Collinsella intestinalis]